MRINGIEYKVITEQEFDKLPCKEGMFLLDKYKNKSFYLKRVENKEYFFKRVWINNQRNVRR